MTTLRERIARAMWEANRARAAGIVELAPWDDEGEELHADWLAFADAALEAMREPTEAMLDAAWPKLAPPAESHYPAMWRNMIDAAKDEGGDDGESTAT